MGLLHHYRIAIVTFSLIFLCPCTPFELQGPLPAPVRRIDFGTDVVANLTVNDDKMPWISFYHLYQFSGNEGQRVQIISNVGDIWNQGIVILLSEDWVELARGGGSNLGSHGVSDSGVELLYTLPQTETYRLVVTTHYDPNFEAWTGQYWLRVNISRPR